MIRWLAALALVLISIACGPAAAPTSGIDRLKDLGARTFVRLKGETRPAVLLRSSETRSCRAVVEPGTRLLFSLAVVDGTPSEGRVKLVVRAAGRTVFEHHFPLEGHEGFWNRAVLVPGSGSMSLEFAATLEGAPRAPDRPFIALASSRLVSPPRGKARTLVWISQDTVRADHLGSYGYARPTSPGFDRMARGWALFENAVATAPWTLPSLASQMTSRYPAYHGAVMETLAANDDPTLFERLADAGFTVLGVTGNPYVSMERSLARGFDALWMTDGRAAEVNLQTLQALDLWPGGDLALFVHYMDPHASYSAPPPYDRMFDDPGYRGSVRGVANFPKFYSVIGPADTDHLKASYDGEIAYTDASISRLFRDLEERGLTSEAVIAYSADHGEEFKDHGYWSHGHTLYEELLHVPFAVRVPGFAARRIPQAVSMVDLAPTLLDALGIRSPPSFQGRSLLPLLRGGTLAETPVFAETILTPDRNQLVSLRSSDLKYVLKVERGRDLAPALLMEELYDLASDPQEQANRAGSRQADPLRRQALSYLAAARSQGHPGPPALMDAEAIEKLRAWGYLQ